MKDTSRIPGIALVLLLGSAGLSGCREGSVGTTEEGVADTTAPVEPAGNEVGGTDVGNVVATTQGTVRGERLDESGEPVHSFRGIPYAAAPVGDLRWKAPQPAASWDGVRDATAWANRCPQPSTSTLGENLGEIDEDCLYLNVVTPAASTADRLPVMVFYHGGGLSIGTANSPVYNNAALPRNGVVLVTVNSRLGPIGYMAHPALTAESEHEASGNYGTLDLIASLEWVQENIAAFGGDPDNVLIFGESGGGTKTLSLLASPLAEGLFHKAIIESGSALSSRNRVTTLESGEAAGEKIAAQLGLQGEADTASGLRAASWQDVVAASSETDYRANVTVDGWVLPMSVHDTLEQGRQHDVPLIVGANAGEEGELKENVPRVAGFWSSAADSDVYVYNFSHMPAGWRNEPCVAFHGVEIPYVFGAIPEGLSVPTILYLSAGGGCTSKDPGADQMDHEVADEVMRMWTAFARTGNPSVEGLIDWPPYTADGERYLDIGYELEVKQGIESAYVAPPEG